MMLKGLPFSRRCSSANEHLGSCRPAVSRWRLPLVGRDTMKIECRAGRCCPRASSTTDGGTAMLRPFFAFLSILLVCPLALFAQAPAQKDEPLDQLAKALKPILIEALPATLYEKTDNWDHQVLVPVGVKWRGIRPQVTKSPRNHGEWKKLII